MIPCPKCGLYFPKKRKELGFHVCINCSTVKPVVGITTVEGSGDHTYNDLIIMDQDKAKAIAEQAARTEGRRAHIEYFDVDEVDNSTSMSNKVEDAIRKDSKNPNPEEEEEEEDEEESREVEGIDY